MSKIEFVEMVNKTAIVTGGAKGYGKAIAKQLIRQGVRVALVDWDLKELQKSVSEMYVERPDGENIYRALSCPGDIYDPATAKEIVAHVEKYVGGISYVVSAAGEETFQVARVVAEMWKATPYVRKDNKPKAIVNVISQAAQAYSQPSDLESRRMGIRTNAIRPLMDESPENEISVANVALWLLSTESESVSDNSIVVAGI